MPDDNNLDFTEVPTDPNDRAVEKRPLQFQDMADADKAKMLESRTNHLLDIYRALNVPWGSDPFTKIAELKKERGKPVPVQLYDSIPLFGYELVTRERIRQITQERFSSRHDDDHTASELAVVAALYALTGFDAVRVLRYTGNRYVDAWPESWDREWDKRDKHDPMRRLVIAGALICAEIDRLQRAAEQDEKIERARLRSENDPRADL